jgi:hypothetical protein
VETSTNTGLSTSLKTNFAYILKAAGLWSQNRHTLGFLSKALEYTSLVNTEERRDALAVDIIEALVHRPAQEIVPDALAEVLAVIRQEDPRDRALAIIMERFAEEKTAQIPVAILDALVPIISRLSEISDSITACRALVRALNLRSPDIPPQTLGNSTYLRT